MRKIVLSIILTFHILAPSGFIYCDSGGASFAGGMAGGMVGGLISGVMTKDSGSRAKRAEEEALRAQDEIRRIERERQYERISGLREEVSSQKGSVLTYILIMAIIILFLVVIGLGVVVFKMRNKKE